MDEEKGGKTRGKKVLKNRRRPFQGQVPAQPLAAAAAPPSAAGSSVCRPAPRVLLFLLISAEFRELKIA